MLGQDVRRVLREKSVFYLHHANTVATSCTFLREGGLASRGYVEDRGLEQTPQYTDADDKRYGIWHDVFTDTVDIHERASQGNRYGPVLFVLSAGILSELPPRSTVIVTKKNPTKWVSNEPENNRLFADVDELSTGLEKGTFGQMIVIRTKSGIVPFPGQVSILLDDPQRTLPNGSDAFEWAHDRLTEAAQVGGIDVSIQKRTCWYGCRCIQDYATANNVERFFG